MSRRLRVAPQAVRQIGEAAAWWVENRPSAPDALESDLERAFSLIRRFPATGRSVVHPLRRGVRRVLLPRVRYYLYYVATEDEVEVLAVWHASRGLGPFG